MVQSTKNYLMFDYNKYNRCINPHNLKKIKDSINRKNLLKDFPINVMNRGGRLIVLDGQHRLEAAKLLGIKVYYTISGEMNLDDIAAINNSRTGWNTENYIARFRDRNECYRFLYDKIENDKLTPSSLMSLIKGYETGGSNLIMLRQGNLTFDIDTLKNKITILGRYAFFEAYKTYSFITALFKMAGLSGFDHDRMIHKMKSNNLEKRSKSKDYIKYFGKMYNHSLSNTLPFSALYKD